MIDNNISKCRYIECCENSIKSRDYCPYHIDGGSLGNGELFEQYQMIESDFLKFINIVPISDPEHLKVHSPVLRDIIIRVCVQIEIFFKEWVKYDLSEDTSKSSSLWEIYNKPHKGDIGKMRYFNFCNYLLYKPNMLNTDKLFVNPLGESIKPFESWKSTSPPFWWSAYNSIKHNGNDLRQACSLKNALFSLGALFELHCTNPKSKNYLNQFKVTKIKKGFGEKIEIQFTSITTPIDSKKYLFKYKNKSDEFTLEIPTLKYFPPQKKGGVFS